MSTNGPNADKGPGRMSDIAASLDALSKNSEPDFLKIGMALQSTYADASNLSQQTLETVGLIGAESDEALLTRVGALVQSSLEKAKTCQTAAAQNHDAAQTHMNVVSDHLNNSFNLCTDLKDSAKYLRSVGLQMRIECSRTAQSMEMFSVVSQEIGAVAARFKDTAEKIREDSKAVLESQDEAQVRASESLDRLFGLANNTEQTVQLSVKEIEQIMNLSLETLEQAGARSRRISELVGEIVMNIQFHDNMRQRIEHISEALLDAEKRCSGHATSQDPMTPSKGSSAAYAILELQKAQLEHIISEITTVHERSAQAFQEIAEEVGNLAQGLSALHSDHADASVSSENETKDPFELLKSGLNHLHQLMDQGFSLVEHMNKTAAQASETVTGLSSHTATVRELSFETHLTAINAMIKAKQLGTEGLTLDKLVQEARIVSERSNRFAANVEKIQDSIATSVLRLQSQTQENINAEEAQISLDEGLADITNRSTQFREKSLDAFTLSESLKRAISHASHDLEFLPALALELTDYHWQLEDIIRTFDLSDVQKNELTQEEIENLRETYTMQEERSIHEQFMGSDSPSVDSDGDDLETDMDGTDMTDDIATSALSSEEGDGGSDFGDNIELF